MQDQADSGQPLERAEFDAAALMAKHPPVWHHPNKRAVFEVSGGSTAHGGRIGYSKWAAMGLPVAIDLEPVGGLVESRPAYFDYEPALAAGISIDWHVNFADPHLFVAYGSSLFAQDKMQVAEHPALGALREALDAGGHDARTVDHGRPTPILVTGVERRCRVATEPSAAEGRPFGLYGNAFANADAETVTRATARIHPPTITNIIAIAAPVGGYGGYRADEIEYVLTTAFSGFRAAVLESKRLFAGAEVRVSVHTGYWGCGAFGGNRALMALLQLVAARMARLDRLVFHTGAAGGHEPLKEALSVIDLELVNQTWHADEFSLRIASMGFAWGVGDGN